MKKLSELYNTVPVERCPICGGNGEPYTNDVLFARKMDEGEYQLDTNDITVEADRCIDCQTIYHNPRMTDEAILKYYNSNDYQENLPQNNKRGLRRAEQINMMVERLNIKPKRCLDVGCGVGYLLRELQVYNFAQIVGLELNPDVTTVIDEVVHSKDAVEGTFDLITCIHTLEHMADPMGELEWMASRLTDNGTIFIEVPNYEVLQPQHIFIFSDRSIEIMMEKLGIRYFTIPRGCVTDIIISDRFDKIPKMEVVYYDIDSPDFTDRNAYIQHLMRSYGKTAVPVNV